MEASGATLLERARAGDRSVLDDLLARHQRRVYRFGLEMCVVTARTVGLAVRFRARRDPGAVRRYTRFVPIYRLGREIAFPDPALADPDGLLAVGGDLGPERLLGAYAAGIFPWYDERSPILWWSPDPRLVLEPERLHVSHSLRRTIRRGAFRVTADAAFERVIRGCAARPRPGQRGTWITEDMVEAYLRLHRLGFAHSFEAWAGEELAGGLYGVSLGAAFFGESMFADRTDASKVAFVRAVEWLRARGVRLVDCQIRTEHLASLGAREIPREDFLARLRTALDAPTLKGKWEVEARR